MNKRIFIGLAGAALLTLGMSTNVPMTTNNNVVLASVKVKKTIVRHNSYVYDHRGKKISGASVIKKGKTVSVFGKVVTIKGKKFVKIGKNRYIKASNLKPKKSNPQKKYRLTKKSYVYDKNGKRTKKVIAKKHVRKGTVKWIKGKKYLKIGDNQFIRFSNVKLISAVSKHSGSNNPGTTQDTDTNNPGTTQDTDTNNPGATKQPKPLNKEDQKPEGSNWTYKQLEDSGLGWPIDPKAFIDTEDYDEANPSLKSEMMECAKEIAKHVYLFPDPSHEDPDDYRDSIYLDVMYSKDGKFYYEYDTPNIDRDIVSVKAGTKSEIYDPWVMIDYDENGMPIVVIYYGDEYCGTSRIIPYKDIKMLKFSKDLKGIDLDDLIQD